MVDYTVEAVRAINEKANELLLKYDDRSKNPAIDPSVDIEKIARACGVKKIEYVSPNIFNGKHATFRDGVVMIDETDVPGQRRFDIAHEIGHIAFQHLTTDTIKDMGFQIVRKRNGDMVIKNFLRKQYLKKPPDKKKAERQNCFRVSKKLKIF